MKQVFIFFISIFIVLPVYTQNVDLNPARAANEFRWGVQVYNNGRFADAIVAFTRALSFVPDDYRTREWLGRAYYHTGFEQAALSEWLIVADNQQAGAYLLSRIENIRYQRNTLLFETEPLRLARSRLLLGRNENVEIFKRPGGITGAGDGGFYVVSVGTQSILHFDANANLIEQFFGGIERLNWPFDIQRLNENLYVTEFGVDRISVFNTAGGREFSFGSTGLEPGQLLGPQFLAVDEDDFVYVSEWGNRRISKFYADGEFVLTIGEPSGFFRGLQKPTGVAVRNAHVYVAEHDSEGVALQIFDSSGYYINRFSLPLSPNDVSNISGTIVEGLEWYDDSRLIIAAGNKAILFDVENRTVAAEMNDEERKRASIAAVDVNGRVLLTDFDANDIGFYEPASNLYSGLDVQVERIISRAFPRIGVLVSVKTRDGMPIVGLKEENFLVSEQNYLMEDVQLESGGHFIRNADMALIVQARAGEGYRDGVKDAIHDIVTLSENADTLLLYIANSNPAALLASPALPERFVAAADQAVLQYETDFSQERIAFDTSLRLAANELISRGMRREIILIGDGRTVDNAFREYSVESLAVLLRTNGIRLHVVLVEQNTLTDELQYIVDQSDGTVQYVYAPKGIAPLMSNIRTHPNGKYWLVYSSPATIDTYIPVSTEVRFFVRSGRDELGFFIPDT